MQGSDITSLGWLEGAAASVRRFLVSYLLQHVPFCRWMPSLAMKLKQYEGVSASTDGIIVLGRLDLRLGF